MSAGPEPQVTLPKLVIRQSMSALLAHRRFDSLDALTKAVEEDLADEGLLLDQATRERIRRVVQEEGHTGRFAFDDILLRKLKNRRSWPILSLLLAGLAFVVSSALGGLIEQAVQLPGSSPQSSRVISAVFQLPLSLSGSTLPFRLTLSNTLPKEVLHDLVVLATAGTSVSEHRISELAPNAESTIEGALDISSVHDDRVRFAAYVIGKGLSFRTDEVEIFREGAAAQARMRKGRVAESAKAESGAMVALAAGPQEDATRPAPSPAQAVAADESAGNDKAEESRSVGLSALDAELEVARLVSALERKDVAEEEKLLAGMLLQAFAGSGHEGAAKYLSNQTGK